MLPIFIEKMTFYDIINTLTRNGGSSMFRVIWVYLNAFFYFFLHIIPIRRMSKKPERFTIEQRFKHVQKICNIIIKKSKVKTIVEGREHLLDDPVLYVANHPSMIDPYFVGYALQKQLGAVIAGDLWFERIPIISKWFKSYGCVFVDRVNPRRGLKGILAGVENLKKGHNLIMFPEGEVTRIISNESVAEFQSGGFKLATKARVPITPIALIGTADVYSAHEVFGKLKKGTVTVKILEPYTDHLHEDKNEAEIALDIETLIKNVIEKQTISS